MLGGSAQQVVAVKYAVDKGYYTVLCDFLLDNPGQYFAHEFHCVSTTDREGILEVARSARVDAVVAYASDPAASTAAYVAETLGLPTNPLASVEILSDKGHLRAFLAANDFNVPKFALLAEASQVQEAVNGLSYPILVKPTDASGSKGISRVDSEDQLSCAVSNALVFSRSQRVILEEFVVPSHPFMIGGDCFVRDGEVEFWGLLNSHRDPSVSPFVPVGTSFPVTISKQQERLVRSEISRLIRALGMRFGAFNLEVLIDCEGRPFIIELGPRNGGNMIPELLELATGVDLVSATVEAALGKPDYRLTANDCDRYLAVYVLHAADDGVLDQIVVRPSHERHVLRTVLYKNPGEHVEYFDGASKAIGVLFLEFESSRQMLDTLMKSNEYLSVSIA